MEGIGADELDAIEARIDAWRASIVVPSWALQRAQWNLLSITEDALRLRALGVRQGRADIGQYVMLLDERKWALKYALAHVRSLPSEPLRHRPDLNDQAEYGAAADLLEAHSDFNNAVASFSAARAGSVTCLKRPDGRYVFGSALTVERQANDLLESRTAAPMVTPFVLLFRFLYMPDEALPPKLRRCVQRTRSATTDPRPRVDQDVLDELDGLLGERREVIPRRWSSRFGTGAELSRAFRNLWLAAVVHVVAITNAAFWKDSEPPTGINIRWLLGEATPNWLAQLLTVRGGISLSAARDLIALLTYGAGTTNPDPALQFLFPLREGLLAIPWFLCATSNSERNFLTLFARVHKHEYDAASSAFEDVMLEDLRGALAGRRWRSRLSMNVPGEREAGEVDAVLFDADTAFVLVVEMRSFVEPSEVGEVADREREGAKKRRQAVKKRDAVRRSLAATLQAVGLDVGTRTWTVEGVVVFDNYLPTPDDQEVPFVSQRAFVATIYREASLATLWQWLRGGSWLPSKDVHFTVELTETMIADVSFGIDGIIPVPDGERFVTMRDAPLLHAWGLLHE